jgi:hypothetical protein
MIDRIELIRSIEHDRRATIRLFVADVFELKRFRRPAGEDSFRQNTLQLSFVS